VQGSRDSGNPGNTACLRPARTFYRLAQCVGCACPKRHSAYSRAWRSTRDVAPAVQKVWVTLHHVQPCNRATVQPCSFRLSVALKTNCGFNLSCFELRPSGILHYPDQTNNTNDVEE